MNDYRVFNDYNLQSFTQTLYSNTNLTEYAMLNKSCNRTHWLLITGVSGAVTNVRVRIWSSAADPAHSR